MIFCLLTVFYMALRLPAIGRFTYAPLFRSVVALIAARNFSGRGYLVRIGQRKTRARVTESRIGPQNLVVAQRTEGSWKARSDVIRYGTAKRGRAVPCRLMAAVAIGVRGGQV